MKNYVGFVNDHSGSMRSLASAAIKDYNANIDAVKHAANTEMLDTVVSVVGVGFPKDYTVTRQVQISNPHVLKPVTSWPTNGGTPLYDGIGNMIELLRGLPDAHNPDVSFLVMITTDGEEMHSTKYNRDSLRRLIEEVSQTGRWTFAIRVPRGAQTYLISNIGIPAGNIQQWDTSAAGLEKSTQVQAQAVTQYYAARSSGLRSSSAFYADASQVNVQALVDISSKVSLYVVPQQDTGIQIRDFVLTKRMQYLKGAAFYQLTKTEARVQPSKLIVVRDRTNGKIYSGKDARKMIGLPDNQNARLHPGDHKNFDIFIQSTSVNRKLVGGTGVIYWEEIGVPFTDADLAYLQPKPAVPAVIQLPAVPVTNRPTPSPIPKQVIAKSNFFFTRELARQFARKNGGTVRDNGGPYGSDKRWEVV